MLGEYKKTGTLVPETRGYAMVSSCGVLHDFGEPHGCQTGILLEDRRGTWWYVCITIFGVVDTSPASEWECMRVLSFVITTHFCSVDANATVTFVGDVYFIS